ncbi:MAG: ABC transporter permease, partial [Candidatus Kapabacteria bacterium]|nr:ABC transporter permease [Candidatus Kapabacteria bacterium]
SLIGITIGVAALIIVISIFNAFQDIAIKQIVGFDPHIQISNMANNNLNYTQINNYLKNNQEIDKFATIQNSRVVFFKQNAVRVVNIKLLVSQNQSYFEFLNDNLLIGSTKINQIGNLPCVWIGAGLADALHTLPSDTMQILFTNNIEQSLLTFQLPNFSSAIIGGIYQSNVKDYDIDYAFASSPIMLKYFRDNNLESYNTIEIRIKNLNKLDKITNELKKQFPNYKIENWKDLNKAYYSVMQFERTAASLLLGLIVIVAVFNIFSSLTMTIIEKRKDIAILRAIGARTNFIRKIYLLEGSIIGIIGSILGGTMGIALCYGQIHYKWFKIDATKYIMDYIPVLVKYPDVVTIVLIAIIIAVLSAYYPSIRASRFEISENLREE